LQVEAADHGGAERFAETGDRVETYQLALAVAQIDLREICRLQEFAFTALDAYVVALAVAGLVVVLGDIDAASQHVDGQRDIRRAQAGGGNAQAIRLEDELRQVELEVRIDASAETGFGSQPGLQFAPQAADLDQLLAGKDELQGLATLPLDHRVGCGKDAGAGNLRQFLAQDGQDLLLRDLA